MVQSKGWMTPVPALPRQVDLDGIHLWNPGSGIRHECFHEVSLNTVPLVCWNPCPCGIETLLSIGQDFLLVPVSAESLPDDALSNTQISLNFGGGVTRFCCKTHSSHFFIQIGCSLCPLL